MILLLCGGDKSSQQTDIAKAHRLAEQWRPLPGGSELMSDGTDRYRRFDVADYLVDLDDIAGYLELAIEE